MDCESGKMNLDIVRKYPKEKLKEYRLVPVYKEGRVVLPVIKTASSFDN